jgi:predicted nucleic acid-binding protein
MAVPLARKLVIDTNIFIDYLRDDLSADWVFGRAGLVVRFLSSIVLMELRLGADTLKRRRAVDRLRAAFPKERIIAPSPDLFERAAVVFRRLHSRGSEPADRLGPVNDVLIALTAWRIGAAVLTRNIQEFRRIQAQLPGLRIVTL